MAEPQTASQGSSLRRLVPRIFSRASRINDLDNLIRTVRANHPKGDFAVISRAYAVAKEKHEGQKRQSGEPYITHPLAVAQILAELGLDRARSPPPCCTTPSRTPVTRSPI